MLKYKTKRLVEAFKLNKAYPKGEKLLAINAKKVNSQAIVITVQDTGERLFLDPARHKPIEERTFKDKYGRGDYTLLYFFAKDLKDRQLSLF